MDRMIDADSQSGREIDALIAEHVMDEPFLDPREAHFDSPEPCPYCGRWCDLDCHYSTDDDAAWAVVRAMWEKGWDIALEGSHGTDGTLAWVGITSRVDGSGAYVPKVPFAAAVCIAALKALGVVGD